MRSPSSWALAGPVAFLLLLDPASAEHSKLWGKHGENWSPKSRLPDFSYAGYRYGEKPIPKRTGGVSVKHYGAKGDGKSDDTAAFKKALAAAKGVVLVPAGRYKITDILYIDKSNIVLRGAGPEKTTLFFPKYLNEVKENWGATTSGRKTSNYSWSGGYLWVRFIHDITYSHCGGNVSKNGRGVDMSFDHHRRAPYANLLCNIDIGEGSRMYRCGGGRALGVHCGAWGTFWNIRAKQPQIHPGGKFGPDAMNFVGVSSRELSQTNLSGKWWETIDPDRLEPQDLHAAQLARRLGRRSRR